jgi:sterol desaturase/sphingolipid hydroxylase (fatty acid hydroxylase superfamily)
MTAFVGSAVALTTLYAVIFLTERTERLRFRTMSFRRRYVVTDVVWYLIVVGMSAVSVLALQPLLERIAVAPVAALARELPTAGRFLLALRVFDLVSYSVHRCLHRSDLLWSIHKVHHSSLQLDALATARQHMLKNGIRFVPGQLVMFMIGIPAEQVAPAVAEGAAFAVVDHSNVKVDLRFLERWFVTPRLHRRHHVPSTAVCNYGAVLSVWDRMFGNFVSMDTTDDERFGCPDEIDTYPQRFADAVGQPPREIAAHLAARRRRKDDRLVVGPDHR